METTLHRIVAAFLYQRENTKERIPVEVLQEVPKSLREIAREVVMISGRWNAVEFYTPNADCLEREKDRFYDAFEKGGTYNPQFRYSRAEQTDMESASRRLRELWEGLNKIPQSTRAATWFAQALREKIIDDFTTCSMVDGLAGREYKGMKGDVLTKWALEDKYWPLDDELLQYAESIFLRSTIEEDEPRPHSGDGRLSAQEQQYLRERTYDAEELHRAFTWALKRYDLLQDENDNGHGFKVAVTQEAVAIDVRHRSAEGPTVFIPGSTTEPQIGQKAITHMRHEIEGHARQVENGWRLFGIMGGQLTCDDETLYEGLAMRQEQRCLETYFGSGEGAELISYPYPIAVALAKKGGSFHDVFADQLNRFLRTELKVPPDTALPSRYQIDPQLYQSGMDRAWRTTYRVMRGHHDTSNPYAYGTSKDLAYARGLLIQTQLEQLGLGHFTEAAVLTRGGLFSLAGIDLTPDDLPLPDRNVTDDFVHQLLKERHVVEG